MKVANVCALLLSVGLASTATGQSFVNWESPQTHPVELTPDGSRLLVLNTPQSRLLVYSLTTDPPSLVSSIPVGLDPVSVRARSDSEAWVVNLISDSVSIVDLTTGNVKGTINVGDEPHDVVFAGSPERAFVSVAALNQLWVFDAANPTTPTTLAVQGEDPRALATDGTKVYAAIFESGNKTTIVKSTTVSTTINPYPGDPNPPPNAGTGFNPPLNPSNPPAPAASLIVKRMPDGSLKDDNNGTWTGAIISNMHDNDVVVFDANTLAVQTPAKSLMNANMAIGLRPLGGGLNEVTVVGTEATNLTRFEPNLQSTFVRVMLGRFNAATPASPSSSDLNPHLTYTVRQVPQAQRDISLGDPRGIVWNSAGTVGYVSGMGSNNLVAIGPGGTRIGQIDLGQGPTGLALDETRGRLYVLNRFSSELSVVDTGTFTESSRVALFDPSPSSIKVGRKFLYDTHLTSGLGQASCASCHIDAKMDQLAWDLGNPAGTVKTFNQLCLGAACANWHPMKGPMVTQTLQGLEGSNPLHWRGDREDVAAFQHAFTTINGDDEDPSIGEMADFTAYLNTIKFPPQPNRLMDNSLPALMPGGGNPIQGLVLFGNANVTGPTNLPCIACHTQPSGMDSGIIPGAEFNGTQGMKIAHFRNMYKKTGFTLLGQTNNRGFGFIHDGTFESVSTFLTSTVFVFPSGSTGVQQRRDLEAYLMCWDPGIHAAVGEQTTLVDFSTAAPTQINLIDAMVALAESEVVGLVVKARPQGVQRGWMYVGAGLFQSDIETETITDKSLRAQAAIGNEITYTVVAKGMETRLGVDRDEDGYFDRDEVVNAWNPDDPASPPPPPACPGDMNGDNEVNTLDLTALLGLFGTSVTPGSSGDFNSDGEINTMDLTTLLGQFGVPCP